MLMLRRRQGQVISDKICATLVHHVLIHGRTMKEAGQFEPKPLHGCIHCPYFQEGKQVTCFATVIYVML